MRRLTSGENLSLSGLVFFENLFFDIEVTFILDSHVLHTIGRYVLYKEIQGHFSEFYEAFMDALCKMGQHSGESHSYWANDGKSRFDV